jgi:glycine dehydrogenase subunit 1
MRYLPHTDQEIREMLAVVGRKSLEDLFCSVPEECRYQGEMGLPAPLDEWQLTAHMQDLAATIEADARYKILIGAGSYDHHIPATIDAIMSRSEFLTAYTPYQPEMAQGTLQGLFEYQTLTARLLGMDVANASIYDGATATAEAVLMAFRIAKKKTRVAVSRALHPHYQKTIASYLAPTGYAIDLLDFGNDGRTDLGKVVPEETAAVVVQSPNFFGVIEGLQELGEATHDLGALFVVGFTEPLSYGLLQSPGSLGADIACGEGQSFGIPRSFGGAALGMFACKEKFLRSMPGRLVGETVDLDGRRGFVLTLATREQHIRREKATSNICSNQGINTQRAAMYMASLGGTGMRKLASLNHDKAAYLLTLLEQAGAKQHFASPFFNEFVVEFKNDFSRAWERLRKQKIIAGLELGGYYPELAGKYLFGVTETAKKEDLESLADEVQ